MNELEFQSVVECPFCIEFTDIEASEFRTLFSREELQSRIILTTQAFNVIVGLGAINPGYLLLVPKIHNISFAHLSNTEAAEAEVIKKYLKEVLSKAYPNSSIIVFEHGATSSECLSGGCISHAHLHFLPTQRTNLLPKLMEAFVQKPIGSLLELQSIRGHKYLYYEDMTGGHVFLVEQRLPSQYFRRLIAIEEGKPLQWDWGIFIEKENIVQTTNTLEDVLQRFSLG